MKRKRSAISSNNKPDEYTYLVCQAKDPKFDPRPAPLGFL